VELEDARLVEGFDVVVRDGFVEYRAGDGTRLAGFPGWEHADRDLRHFVPADVPLGTIDEPYVDADEEWRIHVFEHAGFVYVFEADDPNAEEFPRAFRVRRDTYLEAWARVISAHNPVLPLDAAMRGQGDDDVIDVDDDDDADDAADEPEPS
jgi:hypothetical protein